MNIYQKAFFSSSLGVGTYQIGNFLFFKLPDFLYNNNTFEITPFNLILRVLIVIVAIVIGFLQLYLLNTIVSQNHFSKIINDFEISIEDICLSIIKKHKTISFEMFRSELELLTGKDINMGDYYEVLENIPNVSFSVMSRMIKYIGD